MTNIFCTTQADNVYSALTLNTSVAFLTSPQQKLVFDSVVNRLCCWSAILIAKCILWNLKACVDILMKRMISFSLFFLSAKSFWTGPPLWGFPERQPHREWLLWPRVSEHADELGMYTSDCVFLFPVWNKRIEYPGTDMQIDYTCQLSTDQQRQTAFQRSEVTAWWQLDFSQGTRRTSLAF